jgi:signal transduction histidine kinase
VFDRGIPVRGESGKVDLVAGIAEDITDRKQLDKLVAESALAEQKRIGSDLHDSLGQSLTGIAYLAARLQKDVDSELENAKKNAGLIEQGIKVALQDLRRIVRGLSPVEALEDGLPVAIQQMVEETQFGVDCECHFDENICVDDHATAIHLFRIAQEAFNNALKHSQATRISVRIRRLPAGLSLEVADNGVGLSHNGQQPTGRGLQIMKHRSAMIGGSLRFQSGEQGGTCVSCLLAQ